MALREELGFITLQKSEVPELPPPAGFPAPVVHAGVSKAAEAFAFPHIELTPEETARVRNHQEVRLIFGSAAAAILTCTIECPKIVQCPLAQIHKAPAGFKCPLEIHYARERFIAWAREIGADPDNMGETSRVAVSQLVSIDIQEQRCLDIVAIGEDAKLTQRSVKDCDVNGNPIAWEHIIHQNIQLIDVLQNRRRNILRDWELTPEMQSRKFKGIAQVVGDLASKSAANGDRLRAAMKKKTITITPDTSN
jgi:hypothetical protein